MKCNFYHILKKINTNNHVVADSMDRKDELTDHYAEIRCLLFTIIITILMPYQFYSHPTAQFVHYSPSSNGRCHTL